MANAAAFGMRIILTDSGVEFNVQLFGMRPKQLGGAHGFGRPCEVLNIEHRPSKPKAPQANGTLGRLNARLEQVLRTRHFYSVDELASTRCRYLWLCNEHLPQGRLGRSREWRHSNDGGNCALNCASHKHVLIHALIFVLIGHLTFVGAQGLTACQPQVSVSTTGVWSLGLGHLRGVRSMVQAVTCGSRGWLARIRSMRMPRFF